MNKPIDMDTRCTIPNIIYVVLITIATRYRGDIYMGISNIYHKHHANSPGREYYGANNYFIMIINNIGRNPYHM